jgi:ribosomal silencing factor RsfS
MTKKTEKMRTEDKPLALDAARIARERNCTDITVIDLTGISPATNYFVIATGTSARQARTVADEISVEAKKQGSVLPGTTKGSGSCWTLSPSWSIFLPPTSVSITIWKCSGATRNN